MSEITRSSKISEGTPLPSKRSVSTPPQRPIISPREPDHLPHGASPPTSPSNFPQDLPSSALNCLPAPLTSREAPPGLRGGGASSASEAAVSTTSSSPSLRDEPLLLTAGSRRPSSAVSPTTASFSRTTASSAETLDSSGEGTAKKSISAGSIGTISSLASQTTTPLLNEQLFNIWNRHFNILPVHKDLGRLCKGLEIRMLETDHLFFRSDIHTDTDNAQEHLTRQVLCHLFCALESPALAASLCTDVAKYLTCSDSVDVITGLSTFFSESKAFDPMSRSALVLKCIQQEMIFPCVSYLRKEIYETLPYQDVRGTWKIIVLIGNTSLTVRHKKRERSRSLEDSDYFEFEWELDLKFNPELTAFTSTLSITDITFGEYTTPEVMLQVERTLRPMVNPLFPFRKQWRQPVQAFALHRALPRMMSGFSIIDPSGKSVFQENGAISVRGMILYQILRNLSNQLHLKRPERDIFIRRPDTTDEFFRFVKKDGRGDLEHQFKKFLETGRFEEHTRLMRLLKAMSTEVIQPAIDTIRRTIHTVLKIKDLKREKGWQITAVMGDVYRKLSFEREETSRADGAEFFKFKWRINLTFDHTISEMLRASIDVLSVSFAASTLPEVKETLTRLVAPFRKTNALLPSSVAHVSLSPAESLRLLQRSLEIAEYSPLIPLPYFGLSIPALNLVKSLTESLAKAGRLPPVLVDNPLYMPESSDKPPTPRTAHATQSSRDDNDIHGRTRAHTGKATKRKIKTFAGGFSFKGKGGKKKAEDDSAV